MKSAPRCESESLSEFVMKRRGFEHPPVHMAATLGGDDLTHGVEQSRSDPRGVVTVMRVDDELERPGTMAPGQLGVGDGMFMALFSGDETSETLPAAVDKVQPEVIRERTVAVGSLDGREEALHFSDVLRGHLSAHDQFMHDVRLVAPR